MAKISDPSLDKIKRDTILDIEEEVQEYISKVKELSNDAVDGIPKLDAIEELLEKLVDKTRKNCLTASSKIIDSFDEGTVIESKKENT